MERGEVKVARVGDWQELAQELEGLERVTIDAGNIRFVTTSGRHDDLAVSLALLVWAATRLPPSAITAPRATMPRHRPPPRLVVLAALSSSSTNRARLHVKVSKPT